MSYFHCIALNSFFFLRRKRTCQIHNDKRKNCGWFEIDKYSCGVSDAVLKTGLSDGNDAISLNQVRYRFLCYYDFNFNALFFSAEYSNTSDLLTEMFSF